LFLVRQSDPQIQAGIAWPPAQRFLSLPGDSEP